MGIGAANARVHALGDEGWQVTAMATYPSQIFSLCLQRPAPPAGH